MRLKNMYDTCVNGMSGRRRIYLSVSSSSFSGLPHIGVLRAPYRYYIWSHGSRKSADRGFRLTFVELHMSDDLSYIIMLDSANV